MAFALVFTESYNRRAARWLKRHPDLRPQYLKTLQILEANPHHPSLRLHGLSGKLQGLHSVSINLSYRITLELLIEDSRIVLVNIGTGKPAKRRHDDLDSLAGTWKTDEAADLHAATEVFGHVDPEQWT